jgi:hypothetical protein
MKPFNGGMTKLFERINEFQDKNKLDIYDFTTKDFYDPDFGSFCYPKVKGAEVSLIDDLFVFDAAGLIEIRVHMVNRKFKGEVLHANSYLISPTVRFEEVGLAGPMIPLKNTLTFYPKEFITTYGLHDA